MTQPEPELFMGWVNWTPINDREKLTADRCCSYGHESRTDAYFCASRKYLNTKHRAADQAGDLTSFITITGTADRQRMDAALAAMARSSE